MMRRSRAPRAGDPRQPHCWAATCGSMSSYIDFRNARPKYLENFLANLVNWENVAARM